MNDDKYSAYPREQEVLLVEGCPVCVLDVEEVTITHEHPSWAPYKGKEIVIIYLYHASHDNGDSSNNSNDITVSYAGHPEGSIAMTD